MSTFRWHVALAALLASGMAIESAGESARTFQANALREALTFHASFDGTVDAAHAAGNGTVYSAPTFARRAEATPGLPVSGEVQLAAGQGRSGGALRFTTRRHPVVYFEAAKNVAYAATNWSGSVSFWLSVDPAADLAMGFCDPIQITPRAWNDAAFFVEFEKRADAIPFRLGAYADLTIWNPGNRRFEDIPAAERPLITVEQPPFGRGKWTHVAFTFDRFNTGRADGLVRLYLDGRPAGDLPARTQTFTWNAAESAIAVGLGYVGLVDEISIFNRVLDETEIRTLYGRSSLELLRP